MPKRPRSVSPEAERHERVLGLDARHQEWPRIRDKDLRDHRRAEEKREDEQEREKEWREAQKREEMKRREDVTRKVSLPRKHEVEAALGGQFLELTSGI